ncbi:RNase H family protein [Methylobacterium sp.]|uniref:RNase H family protein n=1 Tax=Methylobacterium sp. TaxID=409 RepID=UPI003B5C0E9B
MGKHLDETTTLKNLQAAWYKIRSNGRLSSAEETRAAIDSFGQNADQKLRQIQKLIRQGKFQFTPQKGVLVKKSSGGHRGIVMASVENRVVERALLNHLQGKSPLVQRVINEPTSVGGVPERSVPHGLKLIRDAILEGKRYFVRSDISGFFDHIPRGQVIERIAADIKEPEFIRVLTEATAVVLSNEITLGEDRRVFPTDNEGVAQGSPLSPLFGNILLNDFDQEFNTRGIRCIRFIDDFVLLAESNSQAAKSYDSARRALERLNLKSHDPFNGKTPKDKAAYGHVDQGFVFLGYDIFPALLQPSAKARQKLESVVADHLRSGRDDIIEVKRQGFSFAAKKKYVQTQVTIDRVLRGWGESFSYSTAKQTTIDLDLAIEKRLVDFREWFARQLRGTDWKTKRRLGGICLLEDVREKSLDDLPVKLAALPRTRMGAKALTISTDGAIQGQGRRKGKDQGAGGWAFVVHSPDVERSGFVAGETNNRMELRAVIEALKYAGSGSSVIIRTDSQYIANTVNRGAVVTANRDLWDEFAAVSADIKLRVIWVKGHSGGDPFNDRADKLAVQAARSGGATKSAFAKALQPPVAVADAGEAK